PRRPPAPPRLPGGAIPRRPRALPAPRRRSPPSRKRAVTAAAVDGASAERCDPRMHDDGTAIPILHVGPLVAGGRAARPGGPQIGSACRDSGFFYVVGHGVDEALSARLRRLSRRFFDQDRETKLRIAMAKGGRAWRGYFPVGGELTSGRPDLKEGIYF